MPSAAAADTCEGAADPITTASIPAAERALLCLVNVHRAAHGVGVLTHDPILNAVARGHSQDMLARNFFSHTNPDGLEPADRARAAGYPGGVGENIAHTSFPGTSPMDFFTMWRNSPGHNENMLDAHAVSTVTAGMGLAVDGAFAGTQMFGTRAGTGTDTALDLLIPDACPPAEAARHEAERKLKQAAKRVKQLKRKVRRADTPSEERSASAKLRKARKELRRARKSAELAAAAEEKLCNPAAFTGSPVG